MRWSPEPPPPPVPFSALLQRAKELDPAKEQRELPWTAMDSQCQARDKWWRYARKTRHSRSITGCDLENRRGRSRRMSGVDPKVVATVREPGRGDSKRATKEWKPTSSQPERAVITLCGEI